MWWHLAFLVPIQEGRKNLGLLEWSNYDEKSEKVKFLKTIQDTGIQGNI